MDCYRMLGENRMAQTLADEVIRAGTDFDGMEHSPVRIAEARITMGAVAAREGDLDSALNYGSGLFRVNANRFRRSSWSAASWPHW
jgi:hypothetical protein